MREIKINAFHWLIPFLPAFFLLGCGDPTSADPGEIFGHVLELGDDGHPVPNVMLNLSPSGRTAITGNDGYYRFESVEPGTYSILYSAQGYTNGEDKDIIVGSGKSIEHPIHIELEINNLAGVSGTKHRQPTEPTAAINSNNCLFFSLK